MRTLKIAAVSMVKNECDIIELFIKINSNYFDALYILDHSSTDQTAAIIKALQSKDYPVFYAYAADQVFDQASVITSAIRQIAASGDYHYLMPIDADEFVHAGSPSAFREKLASNLSSKSFGYIPWVTYCPVNGDYFGVSSPLYENFRRRKLEPEQYYKVILGNDFARNCLISPGNHIAANPNYEEQNILLPMELQHVPVRSKEQIIRKAILGGHALALKKNRKIDEGFHWDLMAERIRNRNYDVSEAELLDIAIRYVTKEGDDSENAIVEDCLRVGGPEDRIEYRELARINLIESLDLMMRNLISQVTGKR